MPLPINGCEQCWNVFIGNQCPVCLKPVSKPEVKEEIEQE